MKMRAVRVSQRRCVRGVVGLKRSTTVENKEKMGRNARGKRVVVKALAEAQKQEEDIDVDLVCLGLVGWWWSDERKKKTMMMHEMCAAPSLSVSDEVCVEFSRCTYFRVYICMYVCVCVCTAEAAAGPTSCGTAPDGECTNIYTHTLCLSLSVCVCVCPCEYYILASRQ